jgi:hypothetical protein
MASIISVVVVVVVSMLINRFATIALTLTGMSVEEARFQARAAMSGVGLTTQTPDQIVSHPVRRRVVFWLMIVGSAGIVTAIASLVLSFRGGTTQSELTRAGVLVGALLTLWLLTRTRPVDRMLTRAIGALLRARGYAARDWGSLLDLNGDYAIVELQVQPDDWLGGRRLRELRLRDEGVIIIGIHRAHGEYVGAPGPETIANAGDRLLLYGRTERISELDRRRHGAAGDAAHREACREQRDIDAREDYSVTGQS